jgi:type IV pilus assembly protein PilB
MPKGYRQEHEPIGDLLTKSNLITKEQLEEAYCKRAHTGERLGDILVNTGLISEEDLLSTLAKQLHIEYVHGERFMQTNPAVAQMIPESIARKYLAIPLLADSSGITVAMSDPFDLVAIDDIQKITQREIKPAIAAKREIEDAINLLFKKRAESQLLEVLKDLHDQQLEIQEHE